MTVIIFGLGAYYKKYKSLVFEKDTVLAITDNNPAKQGTVVDGVPVVEPETLAHIQFDCVVLLLAYQAAAQVREQLVSIGVSEEKILFHDEYIARWCAGKHTFYTPKSPVKLAIVSVELNYNGGTMAIISAARAMLQSGYSVTIVAPAADMKLVAELNDFGISVAVYPSFCNMGKKELEWIAQFDFAVVNIFQNIDCAVKISDMIPMLWWLHEPSENYCAIYTNVLSRWSKYMNDNRIREIPVFAVSHIAERAFKNHFPDVPVKILSYCVKDEAHKVRTEKTDETKSGTPEKPKITFVLIAGFCELKQQKLFLETARKLNESCGDCVRFLLVGKAGDNAYSREVVDLARQIPNVELTGVLTRSQMADLYKNEIDVVVCPSLEETMSLTITEGMMHSKLCIVSDNTGMADYITDGVNGFVCKTASLESLYEKMLYCIEHFDALDDMRRSARKTYEENFTMEIFAGRMDGIVREILENRHRAMIGGGGVNSYNTINYTVGSLDKTHRSIHHAASVKEAA